VTGGSHAPYFKDRGLTTTALVSLTTGIRLEVLSNDAVVQQSQPPRMLEFDKAKTPIVSIGRRPSAAPGSALPPPESSSDSATFRCPVISRRHAQIAYSGDGGVCLPPLVRSTCSY
jgi:hypothetical protein